VHPPPRLPPTPPACLLGTWIQVPNQAIYLIDLTTGLLAVQRYQASRTVLHSRTVCPLVSAVRCPPSAPAAQLQDAWHPSGPSAITSLVPPVLVHLEHPLGASRARHPHRRSCASSTPIQEVLQTTDRSRYRIRLPPVDESLPGNLAALLASTLQLNFSHVLMRLARPCPQTHSHPHTPRPLCCWTVLELWLTVDTSSSPFASQSTL
jgi:hypothetical protein